MYTFIRLVKDIFIQSSQSGIIHTATRIPVKVQFLELENVKQSKAVFLGLEQSAFN